MLQICKMLIRSSSVRAPRPARPDGWDDRLIEAIEAARDRPWKWGRHDCATFCFEVARAMLAGPTAWDAMRGRHGTAWAAARIIRRAGSLAALADMGAPRISPRCAMRGDIAAIAVDDQGAPDPAGRAVALGVVAGANVMCAARFGLRAVPLRAAFVAWPVDPMR
jgi:hypothetical protein